MEYKPEPLPKLTEEEFDELFPELSLKEFEGVELTPESETTEGKEKEETMSTITKMTYEQWVSQYPERQEWTTMDNIMKKKYGGQLNPKEAWDSYWFIEREKLAGREIPHSSPHSTLEQEVAKLALDIMEHEVLGSGRVIDAARARATPCHCYKVEDDELEMCFSPGILGSMSSQKNPEQIREYCATGKEYLKDGITKRIKEFRAAIQEAHKRWEKGKGGLPEWWKEVGKSLEEHGVEL